MKKYQLLAILVLLSWSGNVVCLDKPQQADSKGSWIIPIAGALTVTYIIGQTIYTKIGPKYGGRVRNQKDIAYLHQQAQSRVRMRAKNRLAEALLQQHAIQPDTEALYKYDRESDGQTLFELCNGKDVFCQFVDPLAAEGKLTVEATSGGAAQTIDVTQVVDDLSRSYAIAKAQVILETSPAVTRLVTEEKFPWSKYPWMRFRAWASWK